MSKVWFVTGASSGIGAALVRAVLAGGDRVVATARNLEKLRAAIGQPEGHSLAFVTLDVTNEPQARAAIAAAMGRFGRIDVVVNNAGYSLLGEFESLGTDQIERQLQTNFYGVLHVMRAALPVLRGQGSGHILNVSSMAGVMGYGRCSAYAASKFAVEGLSLSVAQEVERFGIKVTLVEPGFFRTGFLSPEAPEFGEVAVAGYESPSILKQQWGSYHGKQPGDPAKLGEALIQLARMDSPPKQFLAGPDALEGGVEDLTARLESAQAHRALSISTDGNF